MGLLYVIFGSGTFTKRTAYSDTFTKSSGVKVSQHKSAHAPMVMANYVTEKTYNLAERWVYQLCSVFCERFLRLSYVSWLPIIHL